MYINTVLKPVVAESYSKKEMVEILDRRIKQEGQSLYQGARLPMLCFQTGSGTVPKKKDFLLQTLAQALKSPQLSNYQFIIEGHTDSRGKEKQNSNLSQRRAKTSQEWLVKQGGVKKNRLILKSYGEDHPIYPNNSLKNYRYNQRV